MRGPLLVALLCGALFAALLAGCRQERDRPFSPERKRLEELCKGLGVGQPVPELGADVPTQGSKPDDKTTLILLGGKGMGTCHLTVDTASQKLTAVRWQPD